MSEIVQLKEMNSQLISMNNTVNQIKDAVIGSEFNKNSHSQRLDNIEAKLKKLDKYFWMIIGMFSLGTIPLGTKVLPIIKDYLK